MTTYYFGEGEISKEICLNGKKLPSLGDFFNEPVKENSCFCAYFNVINYILDVLLSGWV